VISRLNLIPTTHWMAKIISICNLQHTIDLVEYFGGLCLIEHTFSAL
jgi:hypothetical protein